ncbi:hypothetical protein PP707_07100, partial [Acetobacter pasteurianus]|nr:hypothetical protein [Acetobacter pasteurianus]
PSEGDVTTEYTVTWTRTNEDGSEVTESGIVSKSGDYETTITTFPPSEGDVTTEYTVTWTRTNEDGSEVTESGIVSKSGLSISTISTFKHASSVIESRTRPTVSPLSVATSSLVPVEAAGSSIQVSFVLFIFTAIFTVLF